MQNVDIRAQSFFGNCVEQDNMAANTTIKMTNDIIECPMELFN